jgi:hypothetical protein
MDVEPRLGMVFCHYCNMWGLEGQFSITNMVFGGVIRQVLYHTTIDFFDSGSLTHMANWRRDLE